MLGRTLLRSARPMAPLAQKRVLARNSHYMPPNPDNDLGLFFKKAPVPVEVYPLLGIVAIMCSIATWRVAHHIREDRDHIRWTSKHGQLPFYENTPVWTLPAPAATALSSDFAVVMDNVGDCGK